MREFNPDIDKKVSNREESVRNLNKKQAIWLKKKSVTWKKTSCFLEIKLRFLKRESLKVEKKSMNQHHFYGKHQ